MRRLLATLLVAPAACFGLLACGGDDDDSSSDAMDRYCDLAKQLDDIEQPENVETAEQLAAAMGKFFEDNSKLIDQLKDAAPEEISADLNKAFAVFADVAEGKLDAIQTLDTDKLDKFNTENCE